MIAIYTASAILIIFAIFHSVWYWRKLGEPIQPYLEIITSPFLSERRVTNPARFVGPMPPREYTPAPKPSPTIVQMSRREPMRRRKTKKQSRRRTWDEFDI